MLHQDTQQPGHVCMRCMLAGVFAHTPPTHQCHPPLLPTNPAEMHAAAAGNIVAAMSDLDGFTAKLSAILQADLTHAGARLLRGPCLGCSEGSCRVCVACKRRRPAQQLPSANCSPLTSPHRPPLCSAGGGPAGGGAQPHAAAGVGAGCGAGPRWAPLWCVCPPVVYQRQCLRHVHSRCWL